MLSFLWYSYQKDERAKPGNLLINWRFFSASPAPKPFRGDSLFFYLSFSLVFNILVLPLRLNINIQWCIKHKQNFIMFIIVLGQHVSILIESSLGPSKIQILT